MAKKKVPATWYKEMANELARRIMRAKTIVRFQQERINAVLLSGKDHEVMDNGMIIPLAKLYQFLDSAKEDEAKLPIYEKERIDFKANYEPVKDLKGNLHAAKLEAKLAFINGKKTDYNYTFLHALMNRYKLSDAETTKLMMHFEKIGIGLI